MFLYMDFRPDRRKIMYPLVIALAVYLFVAFFLRCFPLGCEPWDPGQLALAAVYVFAPVFAVLYLAIGLSG